MLPFSEEFLKMDYTHTLPIYSIKKEMFYSQGDHYTQVVTTHQANVITGYSITFVRDLKSLTAPWMPRLSPYSVQTAEQVSKDIKCSLPCQGCTLAVDGFMGEGFLFGAKFVSNIRILRIPNCNNPFT